MANVKVANVSTTPTGENQILFDNKFTKAMYITLHETGVTFDKPFTQLTYMKASIKSSIDIDGNYLFITENKKEYGYYIKDRKKLQSSIYEYSLERDIWYTDFDPNKHYGQVNIHRTIFDRYDKSRKPLIGLDNLKNRMESIYTKYDEYIPHKDYDYNISYEMVRGAKKFPETMKNIKWAYLFLTDHLKDTDKNPIFTKRLIEGDTTTSFIMYAIPCTSILITDDDYTANNNHVEVVDEILRDPKCIGGYYSYIPPFTRARNIDSYLHTLFVNDNGKLIFDFTVPGAVRETWNTSPQIYSTKKDNKTKGIIYNVVGTKYVDLKNTWNPYNIDPINVVDHIPKAPTKTNLWDWKTETKLYMKPLSYIQLNNVNGDINNKIYLSNFNTITELLLSVKTGNSPDSNTHITQIMNKSGIYNYDVENNLLLITDSPSILEPISDYEQQYWKNKQTSKQSGLWTNALRMAVPIAAFAAAPTPMVAPAIAISQVAGSALGFTDYVSKYYDAAQAPDTIKATSIYKSLTLGDMSLHLTRYSLKDVDLKQVATYHMKYGYVHGEVDTLINHIYGRENFNFVQTYLSYDTVQDNLPDIIRQAIAQRLDAGIRFWHNDVINNYVSDNTETYIKGNKLW